ncbi:MAG: DUF2804 domain-containing protein [Candidatus Helarchaeota archaeon]
MQHEITKPSNLLDKRGALIQRGWARRPLLKYNKENIAVKWHRIKEWEHYSIVHEDYALLVTVGDIGYLTLIGVQWGDFLKRKFHVAGNIIPLTRGKTQLPLSSEKGDTIVHGAGLGLGGVSFAFKRLSDRRVLSITYPRFKKLKAKIILFQDPKIDTMVVATPFKHDHRCFYYNHKINMMPAKGWAEFDGKKYLFKPKNSHWGLDWGKGVWPYDVTWLWGTGAGKVDGHEIWFNIGYGFGDLSTHTENMIFYDGVCHKLDQVEFHIDKKRPGSPWKFTSNDGRFEMIMKPLIYNGPMKIKTGLLNIDNDTMWGYYSGQVILDDGTKIKIKNMLGHAEDITWRW